MTSHRHHPAPPSVFLQSKTFRAEFTVHGEDYEVEVATPDLVDAPTRMWADWGPMYLCRLSPGQVVEMNYRCTRTGRQATARQTPPTIEVNSPALWQDRELHPFYLQIDDAARNLRVLAFMDADGEVREAEVYPLDTAIPVRPPVPADANASTITTSERTPTHHSIA